MDDGLERGVLKMRELSSFEFTQPPQRQRQGEAKGESAEEQARMAPYVLLPSPI